MALKPESRFTVLVDGDEIVCRPPEGAEQRLRVAHLSAVYFATGDGPFDADWWILEGTLEAVDICFPLGAMGESDVLERLKQLPGFETLGMNSIEPERFLCWQAPRDGR